MPAACPVQLLSQSEVIRAILLGYSPCCGLNFGMSGRRYKHKTIFDEREMIEELPESARKIMVDGIGESFKTNYQLFLGALVRDSNSGLQLLLPPADWRPIFASWTTQAATRRWLSSSFWRCAGCASLRTLRSSQRETSPGRSTFSSTATCTSACTAATAMGTMTPRWRARLIRCTGPSAHHSAPPKRWHADRLDSVASSL